MEKLSKVFFFIISSKKILMVFLALKNLFTINSKAPKKQNEKSFSSAELPCSIEQFALAFTV